LPVTIVEHIVYSHQIRESRGVEESKITRGHGRNDFHRIAALLIVVLALLVRVWNVGEFPGWFRDEGTYYAVSESIARLGKPALGPLNITFCSPFMTHPPFYFYTGAAWLSVLHHSFTSLRLFNLILSMATLVLVYLFALRHLGSTAALLAAAVFAFEPHIVIFNRMIFPYNLYMLLGFTVFIFCIEYYERAESRFIIAVSVLCFFTVLTVYYAISLIFFIVLLIILKRQWRHLPYLLIPLSAFPLLFLVLNLSNVAGLREDLSALLKAAEPGSFLLILNHYTEFLQTASICFAGTVGLFLLRKNSIRWLSLLFMIIVLFPVMRKADTIIKYVSYPIIPVLPFLALGVAGIGTFITTYLRQKKYRVSIRATVVVLVLALLLLPDFFTRTEVGLHFKFHVPLSFALVQNPEDAGKAAEFVNRRTDRDDLVIASYNIWHLLHAKKSNIPMLLAYEGTQSDFFLYSLSESRFSYTPSLDNASYVICDFITSQMSRAPADPIHYPVRCYTPGRGEVGKDCLIWRVCHL